MDSCLRRNDGHTRRRRVEAQETGGGEGMTAGAGMTAFIRHPRERGDPSSSVILANAGIHPRIPRSCYAALIAKSSLDLPEAINVASQRGAKPRPLQVSPFGPRYLAATT